MKRISLAVLVGLISTVLMQTNPRQKSGYLNVATPLVQTQCCAQTWGRDGATCRTLKPFMQPLIRKMLDLYTQAPRNYILFTVYSTRLPWTDIHAVGIAGQYLFWSPNLALSHTCEAWL